MTIPWIPLISLGSTLLGGLFGKNETQSTNQSGTGTSLVGNTTGQNSETVTEQTQTQNQNSSQQSQQTTSENQVQTQTGEISRLDDQTLGILTDVIRTQLGRQGTAATVAQDRINEIKSAPSPFNSEEYVNSIMRGATSRVNSDIESGGNQVEGAIGASARTNSAAALLRSKINQQGTDALAGIRGDAQARAAELVMREGESRTGQLSTLAAQSEGDVASLINTLLNSREIRSSDATVVGTGVTGGTTTGVTTGTATTKGKDSVSQIQTGIQTGVQTQNSKGSSKGNTQDLSSFFDNIGSIFKTEF